MFDPTWHPQLKFKLKLNFCRDILVQNLEITRETDSSPGRDPDGTKPHPYNRDDIHMMTKWFIASCLPTSPNPIYTDDASIHT